MSARPAPTYERIKSASADFLDSACMDVTIVRDGHTVPLLSLARALDKAGLIDWTGVT